MAKEILAQDFQLSNVSQLSIFTKICLRLEGYIVSCNHPDCPEIQGGLN
jgi:hypothetical protein